MTALLEAIELRVGYPARGLFGRTVEIVHGVDFSIAAGETFGVVGESGSGKTTIGRAVLGLATVSGGSLTFDGHDISALRPRKRRALASQIQVVFQDPYSSLNPSLTVGDILAEPLVVQGMRRPDARQKVRTLLDAVELPADATERLPREFSGGQRQRIAIARALAPEPRLIVCDEPVSALDLSTQSRVLDLLVDIQCRTGVAYLFVSHDLAVVRHVSHRVGVVYRGELVEQGPTATVTGEPEHPVTRGLLLAAPVADPDEQQRRRAERRRFRLAHHRR